MQMNISAPTLLITQTLTWMREGEQGWRNHLEWQALLATRRVLHQTPMSSQKTPNSKMLSLSSELKAPNPNTTFLVLNASLYSHMLKDSILASLDTCNSNVWVVESVVKQILIGCFVEKEIEMMIMIGVKMVMILVESTMGKSFHIFLYSYSHSPLHYLSLTHTHTHTSTHTHTHLQIKGGIRENTS